MGGAWYGEDEAWMGGGRIDPREEFAQGSVSNTPLQETSHTFRLSVQRNNLN